MAENEQEHLSQPEEHLNPNIAKVWQCQADNCNGWMRKSFSLEEAPVCPICQSEMKSSTREIPMVKKKIRRKNISFGRGLRH